MQAKRLLMWTLVGVFVLALASFMVTYTVRFTEAAVVTTFGRADETAQAKQAGLHWKWPYPFQSVTKYDTRMRFVQTKLETQQTRDNKQIIIEAFCLWRVNDPMKFFRRFNIAGERAADHYNEANARLIGMVRSAMASTSAYRLSELFPSDGSPTRLPQLEADMKQAMTQAVEGQSGSRLDDYGIEVVEVGISRIQFPSSTTEAVIQRMIASVNSLVTQIEKEGEAEAQGITSAAESQANVIRAFAQTRASEIRAQGDIDSAPILARLNTNPQLAIFLKNLEMMRDSLSKKLTLILKAGEAGIGAYSPSVMQKTFETGLNTSAVPVGGEPETDQ